MKYTISAIITFCILCSFFLTINSCAVIVPPTGGPRDSIAPVLANSIPLDSSLRFTGNKIVLYFDEYITVENAQQNVIISPLIKNTPLIEGKLRTVTVKFRDTLEANTTYSLNFGKSIKDVNEGNVAKELMYVFSTGNHIDTGTFSGRVKLAETGKIDSTLIVVLHQNLSDTAIVKLPPRYYSRLDGEGRFTFHFLPYGNYAVYALPNDYSRKYDDSTKLFAFLNDTLKVSEVALDTVRLFAYQEEKEKPKQQKPSTKKKTEKELAEEKKLKMELSSGASQDLLTNMVFKFSHKIKSFDSSKFQLYDTSYNIIGTPSFTLDTSLTQLTLSYKWHENTQMVLVVDSMAAVDSNNINLAKNDTLRITTRRESEYGSLRIGFTKANASLHRVLQIFQGDKLYKSIPIVQREWRTKLFPPGEYELRVLNDSNDNSVWDTGNFKERKQPETVISIPKPLKIRPNWDNEVTVEY